MKRTPYYAKSGLEREGKLATPIICGQYITVSLLRQSLLQMDIASPRGLLMCGLAKLRLARLKRHFLLLTTKLQ